MRILIGIAAAIALAGCAQHQARPVDLGPFPVSEYAALRTEGTAVVTGQVFMRTLGGDVKFGAGSEVVLIPATSYTESLYQAFITDRPIAEPDPRAKAYSKRTRADGSGYFKIMNVPAGKYYLSSKVEWQAPTQYGMTPQGGYLLEPVTVPDGEEINVILTR